MGYSNKKGERNEREASNIIQRVYGGSKVEKVDGYSNHDPFGIADIIAIKPGWKVLFSQVKTNSFTNKKKYKRKARKIPHDHVRFEVWVRVDRKGWRIYVYRPEKEEFEKIVHMDTCDEEETVEAYRKAVGYWE